MDGSADSEAVESAPGRGGVWLHVANEKMHQQIEKTRPHLLILAINGLIPKISSVWSVGVTLVKYTIMVHNTQVDEFPKTAIGGWL